MPRESGNSKKGMMKQLRAKTVSKKRSSVSRKSTSSRIGKSRDAEKSTAFNGRMDRWKGKVALVTGASRSIGATICENLCMAGMYVIGCSRSMENLDTLESELVAKKLLGFKKIVCDVGDADQVRQMFTTIRNDVGRLHVVVNNAGVLSLSPLLTADIQDFYKMMNVNVLGLTHVTQQAVRLMQDSKASDAHVINIGSTSGHYICRNPETSFYSATKWAVRMLTESLRTELQQQGSRIRVSCVSPGFVDTGMAHTVIDAKNSLFKGYDTLDCSDVADAVMYMLSTPDRVQVQDVVIRPREPPR